ncbi:tRNA dihydrouridine synthase [Lachnoclostridium phytofermentans]|uniref:tRNA-dihydrouridine synthase n=1 Tax=Lachnoclostridium phytofermentans (strain ATCC 700394 / DSM 18823 / ISDg) TaxID=357809 RepID=A9KT42_LACP7|nr:tRNA-dihydrouridine synthase family protein [Lachnoclostridium phytofermentans]ABX42253.1 dihydrouridine synthase DuS [Lachnoclostridium phytofermentans ISDg]
MKFYFAPMEGVTGYIYRNIHHSYFPNVDKYFTPFIVANQSNSFKTRELQDIKPEHNQGMYVVPQILTNNAQDFIQTSRKIAEFGYDEINLNLGCPSGTVVAKGKGSGFLVMKDELNRFLEEVFQASVTKISIKTRIGRDNPEEFHDLMSIFNQYPLEELIIHPRIQKDMYKNTPNLPVFAEGLLLSKHEVCYNGDIFTVDDYKNFIANFPQVKAVMLGRGIIANPAIIQEITLGKGLDKSILKEFHSRLVIDYQRILSGDRDVLFKMKEVWHYWSFIFTNSEKYIKKIRKAQRISDYVLAVENLFYEQEIKKDAGYNS